DKTMTNILVVEDEKNQALLYRNELSAEGYSVSVARDGREAVTMAKLNPPDLLVLDINMPGMDGIEAMGKILGENNRIPIVINTAYSSFKDNFMTWSADAYIVKSADLTELKKAIKEILERRKAQ
ncbi:MAG: response regulator, partial [Planctomycetota bacterium]